MREIQALEELRSVLNGWRSEAQSIVLVPTMGNLHDGHLHLVSHAQTLADRVVVSLFVNPLQFSAGEDFDHYPRTLAQDREQLAKLDTDLLFNPTEASLYPLGREQATSVAVPELGDILCGQFRPGHFVGVATVVAKLFNLVRPDVAVFGKKDYQQLLVIRRLVSDLNFPIEIVGVDTVREADGLAISSRNNYLSDKERQQAVVLSQLLFGIKKSVAAGEQNFSKLQEQARLKLSEAGFKPEYIEIRSRRSLAIPDQNDTELVVLAAAYLGRTRLIDNVEISR